MYDPDQPPSPPEQPPLAPADGPPQTAGERRPAPEAVIPVWADQPGQPPAPAGSPPDQPPPPVPARQPLGRVHTAALLAVGVAVVVVLVARDVVGPETVRTLAVLFVSVILHEVSHGVVALGFGDDTAKRAGRLTLNPVAHVDVFGTIILPTMLVLANAPPFGWAKPVPVNPSRLRSPRNHTVVVSLAGPAVNIVLALVAAVVLRSVLPGEDPEHLSVAAQIFISMGIINVVLAVFNLIPIPPLDGSAVIERLLPAQWWPRYLHLRQYSMLLLLALVFMVPGGLDPIFDPAVRFWARLI